MYYYEVTFIPYFDSAMLSLILSSLSIATYVHQIPQKVSEDFEDWIQILRLPLSHLF